MYVSFGSRSAVVLLPGWWRDFPVLFLPLVFGSIGVAGRICCPSLPNESVDPHAVVPLSPCPVPVEPLLSRFPLPFPVSRWRVAAVGESLLLTVIFAACMWNFNDPFAGNDGQR